MIGVFWKRESRPVWWHQCRLLTRQPFSSLHIYGLLLLDPVNNCMRNFLRTLGAMIFYSRQKSSFLWCLRPTGMHAPFHAFFPQCLYPFPIVLSGYCASGSKFQDLESESTPRSRIWVNVARPRDQDEARHHPDRLHRERRRRLAQARGRLLDAEQGLIVQQPPVVPVGRDHYERQQSVENERPALLQRQRSQDIPGDWRVRQGAALGGGRFVWWQQSRWRVRLVMRLVSGLTAFGCTCLRGLWFMGARVWLLDVVQWSDNIRKLEITCSLRSSWIMKNLTKIFFSLKLDLL